MSPVERTIPPVGEEIHLPGGSLHPVLLTVGVTLALVGVTVGLPLSIAGIVLVLAVLVRWGRGAKREFDELPAEHHSASHDTAPLDPPGPTRES